MGSLHTLQVWADVDDWYAKAEAEGELENLANTC